MQTSGFFTAQQLDDGSFDRAYTAEQFAHYFSKFIGNGIFVTPATQLQVSQSSDLDMSVNINIGDAYINGYWFTNSAIENVKLSNATGSQDRIDMIVLRWTKLDRAINIAVVEGTASSDAQPPELTRSDDVYEICLAEILVNKTITGITNSLIVDTRSDSDLCGYVKGVVDQIDATNLFQQFTSVFNEYITEKQKDFDSWSVEQKEDFDTWFETIKDKLDGDTAGKLADDITELQKNKEDKPAIIDATLTTGETTLTIESDVITDESLIDIYADSYGISPTNASDEIGKLTLEFDAQEEDVKIKVVIK